MDQYLDQASVPRVLSLRGFCILGVVEHRFPIRVERHLESSGHLPNGGRASLEQGPAERTSEETARVYCRRLGERRSSRLRLIRVFLIDFCLCFADVLATVFQFRVN